MWIEPYYGKFHHSTLHVVHIFFSESILMHWIVFCAGVKYEYSSSSSRQRHKRIYAWHVQNKKVILFRDASKLFITIIIHYTAIVRFHASVEYWLFYFQRVLYSYIARDSFSALCQQSSQLCFFYSVYSFYSFMHTHYDIHPSGSSHIRSNITISCVMHIRYTGTCSFIIYRIKKLGYGDAERRGDGKTNEVLRLRHRDTAVPSIGNTYAHISIEFVYWHLGHC